MVPTASVRDYSGNPGLQSGEPSRWWDMDLFPDDKREDVGPAMVATARSIETSPSEQMRADLNLLYGSLFEGRELQNLYQYGGQATVSGTILGPGGAAGGDITWNVIRSVVLTVASQVSRSRPRARILATDGDYRQKRKAKKLTTFVDGLFHEARVYETTQEAFVAAGAFDVAGIEVHRERDRVAVSLVRACEIMVGANDGIDGKQRSMYRRKYIDRGVLMAAFGKGKNNAGKAEAIEAAQAADPTGDGNTNLIEVFESWHLRSSPEAKDGWHCISLPRSAAGDATLLLEEYTRDYHPIILFRWDPALAGPYGRSAAEILLPIQVAVNTQLDKIARCQHLTAVPRAWVHVNSKVSKASITNAPAGTYYFSGTQGPPVFQTPQALNAESYSMLEQHYQKAFALYGVNTSVAAGQKEAGTTSAVAIREALDVQTARFAVLSQRWEQLHMDIARAAIDTARDIYLDNEAMQVSAPGTALLETIDWKDVDMEEDAWVIQPYPASLLPQTPQGRIDRVKDLVASQIWTPARAEAALDDLDPDSHEKLSRAPAKNIERICDTMLVDGKYEGPEPYYDFKLCLKTAMEYVNSGQIDLAEAKGDAKKKLEKNIDFLYRWMDDVAALMAAVSPPAGAPPSGPPGAPPVGAAPAGQPSPGQALAA
jgi:hypothetical protein